MDSFGVSTWQILLMVAVAFSLLLLTALLWMNHRTLPMAMPSVLFIQAGVVYPVEIVLRRSQASGLPSPARAPPTFFLPSTFAADPAFSLMVHLVVDSAEVFR